jgi:hypothetical protein
MRERLGKLGIDPDRLPRRNGTSSKQNDPGDVAEQLEKLRDLRDKGVLTEEAYEEARERLRRY